MKHYQTLLLILLSTAAATAAVPLNVGKELAAPPAPTTLLGDLPMSMALTSDGKFMIAMDMGYRDTLWAVPTAGGEPSSLEFVSKEPKKARAKVAVSPEEENEEVPSPVKTNGLYYGLAVSGTGEIYVAQGAHDTVAVLGLESGVLKQRGEIRARTNDFPAGLAVDSAGHLFVVNNVATYEAAGHREPASVAIYDTATKKELGRCVFPSVEDTSTFPLAVQATRDGKIAYVTSERDNVVYVVDASNPTDPKLKLSVAVGAHPTALLLDHDENRLYVANSLSDTISVIDTKTNSVVGTVLLRPDAVRGLVGATPNALSLSTDEKTLFVALSDMDAIGVVDVPRLTLRGMMPTGWYPSAVHSMPDGKLMVLNAKGNTPRHPNPKNTQWVKKPSRDVYILNLLTGTLQTFGVPADLRESTDMVMAANHLDPTVFAKHHSIGPAQTGIKHVIYIIKENRTYDQVLGDDPRGNGDPSLTLFGKEITPNFHALADRFVLLDNCYACGEVSGDGWVWSTQGMANAYVERNIPYHYSHRGRAFDYEGENDGLPTGGFPAKDPDGKPLSPDPAYRNGAKPFADVGSIGTHLWDSAEHAGVSVRNYGFFLSAGEKKNKVEVLPENYPTVEGLQPPGHDLAGVTDIDYRRFDLDYADSDAPSIYFDQTKHADDLYKTKTYGKYNAPSRFAEWHHEFKEMLSKDPTGAAVPQLMLVRMPHDHTQGLSPKHHTPRSENADNDFGVAELVQAVSESPIWKSTAIFVIEDDAQAGPDHVDCHRTTGYVISPWIKRATVDHRFYNTDSFLKTMELILGLPPMSQYDAIAKPIDDFDTTPSNLEPYKAVLPAERWIADVTKEDPDADARNDDNHDGAKLIEASEKMDFDHADAAPVAELNEIIWKSVKGLDSAMPAPKNTMPFPAAGPVKPVRDDDGD